jgi:serine/threonine-protein kinase HipA
MKRLVVYLNSNPVGALDQDDGGLLWFRYDPAWLNNPDATPLSRVLIGNADAHGKNYSILYRKGERRLAPLYDLVCTLAWPELSKTPAMKIGKSDSIETVTPAHWQKMAQETHVSWPLLRERIADLSGRTLAELPNTRASIATNDLTTADRVAGIIEGRASSLLQGLK